MQERILQIILLVLTQLREDKQVNEEVSHRLTDQGFTESEISTAYSWIAENIENPVFSRFGRSKTTSFRVLHEFEESLFSKEAQGLLMQLQSLGLIDNIDIEVIIQRILYSGMKNVDIESLRRFASMLLFPNYFEASSQRFVLLGNESIN